MANNLQKHLEIPQIPMTVLAIDTMSFTSHIQGDRWVLTAICLHTSYVFTFPMREKSAENAMQANISDISAHKGGSVAILSDSGTEFKNKVLNEMCDQLGIMRLFSNPFHLQDNSRIENVHNFLK